MKKLLSILSAVGLVATGASTVTSCGTTVGSIWVKPLSQRDYKDFSDVPMFSYVPQAVDDNGKTISSDKPNASLNAWANDPVSTIKGDDGMYYSWEIFRNGRNFQSDWVEMKSSDLKTWTQTDVRIKYGRDYKSIPGMNRPSVWGGSTFLMKTDSYGFKKGNVIYLIAMPPCEVLVNHENNPIKTGDMSLVWFKSDKLGDPVTDSGILSYQNPYRLQNPMQVDFRDPFLYWNPETNLLNFAIAAHDHIEFWEIEDGAFGRNNKRFSKDNLATNGNIKYLSSLYVRPVGVEVPNVVYLGENKWYVSCSVQDNNIGGPYQTTRWFIGTFDENNQFIPANSGDHEFGTEGYAQRVNDPDEMAVDNKGAKVILSRTNPLNWNYDFDILPWLGGAFTTEQIHVDGDTPRMQPLGVDGIDPIQETKEFISESRTAVLHLQGKDFNNPYGLKFNDGSFEMQNKNGIFTYKNNIETGMLKWRTKAGSVTNDDKIELLWNYTSFEIINVTAGWVAHFLMPSGTKIEMTDAQKAKAVSWKVEHSND